MLRTRHWTSLFIMAALCLPPSAAMAQEEPVEAAAEGEAATGTADGRIANGTQFGVWTVTCTAVAVNETACVLSQRLAREADKRFLAEFLAFRDAAQKRTFLAVRVPNGAYLPAGFAMRPQASPEEDKTVFVWQACSRDLCEGLVELTGTMAADFEAASTLVGGYRPGLTADPVVFTMSFKGLEAGLAALSAAAAQ